MSKVPAAPDVRSKEGNIMAIKKLKVPALSKKPGRNDWLTSRGHEDVLASKGHRDYLTTPNSTGNDLRNQSDNLAEKVAEQNRKHKEAHKLDRR
jgi:hypothetical protein